MAPPLFSFSRASLRAPTHAKYSVSNPIAIDFRSLAAFRIAVAVCVLGVLCQVIPDAAAFYTDGGILPRTELLSWFAVRLARPVSLSLSGGSLWSQALLLSLAAVAAVALLVGYRTRTATIVCWILLSSIQLRNPFIVFGADVFLRLLLFWGCFLPLGERCSVDAARRGGRGMGELRIASIASGALLVQVSVVFVIAGLAKTGNPVWTGGAGVFQSVDYQLLVTSFGQGLKSFPQVCTVLSYMVMSIELAGPLLLFVPWFQGPLRTVVLAAMVMMLLGFAATLRVGHFPWVSVAGLLPFVPSWLWDHVPPRAGALVTSSVQPILLWWRKMIPSAWRDGVGGAAGVRHPPPGRGGRVARLFTESVAAAALIYSLLWNVGLWYDRDYVVPGPLGWLGETLNLRQRWGMFTRLPSTGWLMVPGTLRDGRTVDLFRRGGPLPDYEEAADRPPPAAPPAVVSAEFKSLPWLVFFLSVTEAEWDTTTQLQGYGRYVCREWNVREQDGRQLDGFQLIYMKRQVARSPREHSAGDYERVVLWTHRCFG